MSRNGSKPEYKLYKVPELVRTKCLTCDRFLPDMELFAQICPVCFEDRIKNLLNSLPQELVKQREFTRCFECQTEIVYSGLKTWDRTAKSFKFVCHRCGEKQLQTDRQYKDTPFGYKAKLR